jgi:hypothetical protein
LAKEDTMLLKFSNIKICEKPCIPLFRPCKNRQKSLKTIFFRPSTRGGIASQRAKFYLSPIGTKEVFSSTVLMAPAAAWGLVWAWGCMWGGMRGAKKQTLKEKK